MNAQIVTDALVIRRADWRDYDRMLTLFTPDYGRVDAVARGCRRAKSQLMNAAEPFCAGEYQLLRAHDRYTVTGCRVYDGFYALREDYERLTHGAFWLRLLGEVVVEDEPNEKLFHMTLRALAYLANSALDPKLLTAMFEMQLWYLTGFAPNVTCCVGCGKSPETTLLGFDARRGGAVCKLCAPAASDMTENARRILLKAPRTPYQAVEKLAPRPEWPEAARLIRAFTQARLQSDLSGAPEV